MTRLRLFLDFWAARVKALTFEDAARLLPVATASAAAVSIGLVLSKIWRTPHFPYAPLVVMLAVSACVLSLMLSMLLRRLATSWSGRVAESSATDWLLAIELGLLLLVFAVFLLVKSVPEEDMTGWQWPLVNKRWLLALYGLAVATSLLFPAAIARWRADPTDPPAWTGPRR